MPRPIGAPHRPITSLPPVAAAIALAGCAVGPDFKAPSPPAAAGYTPQPPAASTEAATDAAGAAQRFTPGQDIPAQWWLLFHCAAINDLVQRAVQANPDLASAKAALKIAKENAYAERSVLLPTVDADYNVSRQQASATLAPPLTSGTNLFTLHTAQVTVGYVADVFGGSRRQLEAAQAQADSQRFQTEAAYLTLTASVAEAAIQQASLRDQLAASQAVVDAARQTLSVMRRQFELGQIARADLAVQEASLAQAEAAVPALQKQLDQQNDLINDLTGQGPDHDTPPMSLTDVALPLDLPLSLPAQLVEQRPDVRAAAANLHAASAQVGVAIAARLPNITLSANAGGASNSLQTLLSNGNGFWSVGADFAQPIFEGGALLHRQRAAQAGLEQAKAQYQSTVLAALQNVADTLQALKADARVLQAAATATNAAAESLDIAKHQLALGQIGGLGVVSAEQTYQQALSSLVQARAARFSDTAALFEALGGGWWNRTDPGANS